MGSDHGRKLWTIRSIAARWWGSAMHHVQGFVFAVRVVRRWAWSNPSIACAGVAAMVGVCLLVDVFFGGGRLCLRFGLWLPAPELVHTSTFVRDYGLVPPRCINLVHRFDECQRRAASSSSSRSSMTTVVFACHRAWCQASHGHCEPCSGIGDRTRYLLSQVADAAAVCHRHDDDDHTAIVRVQVDSPSVGMALLESAVYRDPSGWWGHSVWHTRSYDVSERNELDVASLTESDSRKKKDNGGEKDGSVAAFQKLQRKKERYYYTHFTPHNYTVHKDYDACYFHALFAPTPQLQEDLLRHTEALFRTTTSAAIAGDATTTDATTDHKAMIRVPTTNMLPHTATLAASLIPRPLSIGIHFRTGDTVSFGIDNQDVRLGKNTVWDGWDRMQACAIRLAERLYPNHDSTQQHTGAVVYFLATDSASLKQHVRVQQQQTQQSPHNTTSTTSSPQQQRLQLPVSSIYLTDDDPQSFLRGHEGEYTAWLEILLLSQRQGLVVNVQPHGYRGPAARISHLARLAQKLGFLSDDKVEECRLDTNERE